MSRLACAFIVAASCAVAFPASAQKNDYGGHDIAGDQPVEEYAYAEVRGWRVMSSRQEDGFAYCVAEGKRSDGHPVRIGWDGQQWQLAVPFGSSPDWQGTLQVDGKGSGRGYGSGGDNISGTGNSLWTIAWLGGAELDGLRKGSNAVLGVGKFDFDFSLAGATAATLKVEECVELKGEAASTSSAEPGGEPSITGFATAGSWTINAIRDGARVIACEAFDTTMDSLRFEIDSENSYIDFRDGGEMGNLGDTIEFEIAFGPGSSPMPGTAQIIEGRDGNKWARITEGRMDGPGLLDDAIPNSRQISFMGSSVTLDTPLDGSKKALDQFFRCMEQIQ